MSCVYLFVPIQARLTVHPHRNALTDRASVSIVMCFHFHRWWQPQRPAWYVRDAILQFRINVDPDCLMGESPNGKTRARCYQSSRVCFLCLSGPSFSSVFWSRGREWEGAGFLGKTSCECFRGDLLRGLVYWQTGGWNACGFGISSLGTFYLCLLEWPSLGTMKWTPCFMLWEKFFP